MVGVHSVRHDAVVIHPVLSKVENLGILPYHRFTGKTIGKIILPVKILVTILSQNNSEMWSIGKKSSTSMISK